MQEGIFTGHKLGEFVNKEKTDYVNARRVINGLDRAQDIANSARKFESILSESDEAFDPVEIRDKLIEPKPVIPTPTPVKKEEPTVTTVQGQPPTVEVKNQSASLATKIAAASGPIATILGATGLKIGGVEFHTGGLIAFAAVAIAAIIVGAVVYDRGQERAFQRQKLSMENLANKDRGNVVAAAE